MLYIHSPHLICSNCGSELRTVEGTTVPSIDLILFGNFHNCLTKTDWTVEIGSQMPEKYGSTYVNGHRRLVRIDRSGDSQLRLLPDRASG